MEYFIVILIIVDLGENPSTASFNMPEKSDALLPAPFLDWSMLKGKPLSSPVVARFWEKRHRVSAGVPDRAFKVDRGRCPKEAI